MYVCTCIMDAAASIGINGTYVSGYVCMCLCMYVCTCIMDADWNQRYVCITICMYVCLYMHNGCSLSICVYVCMYVCICIMTASWYLYEDFPYFETYLMESGVISIYECLHTYIHTYIHESWKPPPVRMDADILVHTYMYIHIYIYTYIHIKVQSAGICTKIFRTFWNLSTRIKKSTTSTDGCRHTWRLVFLGRVHWTRK